ncbi:3890_t:CDS:2 [Dentiscutata erythropus]|uniref:3890_t:CDS:1 n=1 Tax=Dentiscutata erythropus TaxID=1348616 RepID=A0A9N9H1T2_9GLOM|nr:3890_t:CDS:2 [Dentiscutata erythropus]
MDINCLVEGEDPYDNIFVIRINKNEHVNDLKKAIKMKLMELVGDYKELKLWKVDVTLDRPNEKLEVLENKECAVIKEHLEGMRLDAFKKINEYFPDVPKEYRYRLSIIIERPPVIKSISSQVIIEFSIKISHGMHRKSLPWIVDLSSVSLNDIKHEILDNLPFPQDTTTDILTLRFSRENDKSSAEWEFKNDNNNFQEYIEYCVMTSSLSLKVQVYTLQKAFSEWKLGTVCDLFKLPPYFEEFSKFNCGVDGLENSKAEELLKHLYNDLRLRKKVIRGSSRATKSQFIVPFLVIAALLFDGMVKLYPEYNIQGKYGQGPLDFCLYLKGIIVGVVVVKNENFNQGVAQIVMQLHSSLEKNRKRKRNEMEEIEDLFVDKAYGIVTDSFVWYFIECTVNEDDKLKVSIHSRFGSIIDWSKELESLESGARRILGHIVWLLKEAEKLIEFRVISIDYQ